MEREAWLSGNLKGVAPILMPAAHALVQAALDIEQAGKDLTTEEIWTKPAKHQIAEHVQDIAEI